MAKRLLLMRAAGTFRSYLHLLHRLIKNHKLRLWASRDVTQDKAVQLGSSMMVYIRIRCSLLISRQLYIGYVIKTWQRGIRPTEVVLADPFTFTFSIAATTKMADQNEELKQLRSEVQSLKDALQKVLASGKPQDAAHAVADDESKKEQGRKTTMGATGKEDDIKEEKLDEKGQWIKFFGWTTEELDDIRASGILIRRMPLCILPGHC
jgi:hypothetical protein